MSSNSIAVVTGAGSGIGKAAAIGAGHDLYEANHEVYDLLRYGVKVKPGVGEQTETVWLIDWNDPNANHFVVAEEVTVLGQHTKRPDVVLYVNGIAFAAVTTIAPAARSAPVTTVGCSARPSCRRVTPAWPT